MQEAGSTEISMAYYEQLTCNSEVDLQEQKENATYTPFKQHIYVNNYVFASWALFVIFNVFLRLLFQNVKKVTQVVVSSAK